MDYPVRNCTRYAVEENQHVKLFFEILNSESTPVTDRILDLLGELMYRAHVGYTDCGLGSVETDLLVNLVRSKAGQDFFSAKITGGGAGGTVAILGRNTQTAKKAFTEVVASYKKETGIDPFIFTGSSQEADAFGIFVI